MKKHLLFLVAFVFVIVVNAQDSVIFYPPLNDNVASPGYSIQDVNKPNPGDANNFESSFWWDDKESYRTPPPDSILGYTQDEMSWAHRIRGFDKVNYFVCETWFVVDAVDLTNFVDNQVTFCAKSEYTNGAEGSPWFSNLDIMISTDYIDDVTTATWTTKNDQLDTIDQQLDYDAKWVKSTLSLADYSRESNVSFAFRYTIDVAGTLLKPVDDPNEIGERPGSWVMAEVRFTGTYDKAASSIADKSDNNQKLVFPNPASDIVYFQSEKPLKVNVYNVTGQVMNVEYSSESGSIDISTIPSGMYFIKATLDSGDIRVTRLIKR